MDDFRKERRQRVVAFLFPACFGLMCLSQILGRPSVAALRPRDVISIFACGMLFGVALINAVRLIRHK